MSQTIVARTILFSPSVDIRHLISRLTPIIPIVRCARTYYDLPRHRKPSVSVQRHGRRSENILEGYWPARIRMDSLSSYVYIPTSRGLVVTHEHPLVHSQRASQVGDKLPGKQTNRKPLYHRGCARPSLVTPISQEQENSFSPLRPFSSHLTRSNEHSRAREQIGKSRFVRVVRFNAINICSARAKCTLWPSLLISVKLEGLFHCHLASPVLANASLNQPLASSSVRMSFTSDLPLLLTSCKSI